MDSDQRHGLRERFLAEQQTQLAEDEKLADPADAYQALVRELAEIPDGRADRAA